MGLDPDQPTISRPCHGLDCLPRRRSPGTPGYPRLHSRPWRRSDVHLPRSLVGLVVGRSSCNTCHSLAHPHFSPLPFPSQLRRGNTPIDAAVWRGHDRNPLFLLLTSKVIGRDVRYLTITEEIDENDDDDERDRQDLGRSDASTPLAPSRTATAQRAGASSKRGIGRRRRSAWERATIWLAKNSTAVLLLAYFGVGVAFYCANEPW